MPDNDTSDFLSHDMKPVQQMLGFRAEVPLEIPHGVSAMREKGELLIHLEPLGLPELEQAALGLRVNGLDKAKAPTRRDIFFVLLCEGEDTLAHDDFKLPLFLVPITHIPRVVKISECVVPWTVTDLIRASPAVPSRDTCQCQTKTQATDRRPLRHTADLAEHAGHWPA
jgi:hypothetical protein